MRSSRKLKHKSAINRWFYIVIAIVLLSIAVFFFYKMQSNQGNTDQDNLTNIQENNSLSLKRYFMPSGTTAYFKGTGNEYASYKETTTWLGEDYVQTIIENGGAIVEKIYRITTSEVQLVLQQEVAEQPTSVYTEQELHALESIAVMLTLPFEEGKKMGNRQMVILPTEIDTAYGHFTDVMVVEEVLDNGKTRYFYAPDYGVVRTEFYYNNELAVTSELASINEPYLENE